MVVLYYSSSCIFFCACFVSYNIQYAMAIKTQNLYKLCFIENNSSSGFIYYFFHE